MIDWKRVTDLRDEIGAQEFDEVVELFLEEVETMMSRLRERPDPATFEEDMHFLKGCAINLGFRRFAQLCLAGETLASSGGANQLDLAEVLECYEVSRAEFLSGIEKGLAA